MKFDKPQSVVTEANSMLLAQQPNARNRTLVAKLFNGEAPYSDEERRTENLKTNVNFLEATRVASNATSQLNNAFFKSNQYFSVNLDIGPVHKRAEWSASITKHINRLLKKSRYYKSARESAHAQVVLHGPGPLVWKNRRSPVPTTIGIDDVLLPSGTLCSMDNLDRFCIYREWTWPELYDMTQGKAKDPGWNAEYAKALLASLYKDGVQPIYQGNRWLFPEKLAEDLKEGAATTASSALPKITCWDFFYRNQDNDKWGRKIAVDYGTMSGLEHSPVSKAQEFLYQKDDYADDWQEIIHWYIGNCSNVAPYRYYSIRSVGFLLYGICNIQNKLRNRLFDHLFQSLLTLFRNVSDDHREKLGMIDLQNFGILPDGLSMVLANERHQADWNLIMMGLNQGRQLMAESSQSFVPDMQSGPQKEMTATETLVRQNTSITLTSAVLNQLGDQSTYEYNEIARRFCIKGNPDPMAVKFRECLERDGVPLDVLDSEYWEIKPEMTVGGGNKAVELTVTQALMQEMMPIVDPNAQRIIARRRYLALTDNPEESILVIPDAPAPPSDDVQYAQSAFSILMLGMPFIMKEGVNHVAFGGMLLQMMQTKLQQTQQILGTPNGVSIAAEWLAGLANVAQMIQGEIQVISQDERKREIAKGMMKALEEMVAVIQDMSKKLAEMNQQQQGGISPETQAKIQEKMMLVQAEAQAKQMKSQHGIQLKEAAFLSENERRNAMTAADIERKQAQTVVDLQNQQVLAQAEAEKIKNQPTKSDK